MNTDSHFSVKQVLSAGDKDLPAPMQERSRKTADKFVSAALGLLQKKTYAELSVAELARAAGRSVGVFYQRFGSKDDFLSVLLTAYFRTSLDWREAFIPSGTPGQVYAALLAGGYNDIITNKNLWHAALERSAADEDFWLAYNSFRERVAILSRGAIESSLGSELTEEERHRLALAGQVFNSVINNQIINGPGPLTFESEDFLPELTQIALKVAQLP